MNGFIARVGAWLLGLALDDDIGERAALRRDGYVAAIDDALEIARKYATRADIDGELCRLRAEVTQPAPL